MDRRAFMGALGALGLLSCRPTGSSALVGLDEGPLRDLPGPQSDYAGTEGGLDRGLGDGVFAGAGQGLGAQADLELRAISRMAPRCAAAGGLILDGVVTPLLNWVGDLQDDTPASEEDLAYRMAQALDLSQVADELQAALVEARDELDRLGPMPTSSREQTTQALHEVAAVFRTELRRSGGTGNPFATQMVLALDQMALECRDGADLMGAGIAALDQVTGAAHLPPPPHHDLCQDIEYATAGWERQRAAIGALIHIVAETGWAAYEAVNAAYDCVNDTDACPEELQDLVDLLPDGGGVRFTLLPHGSAIPLLVSMGVVAMLLPFYFYTPVLPYSPLVFRMCDCAGVDG